MLLEVFEMQELERHAFAAELQMHGRRIRLRSPVAARRSVPIEARLEHRLIELLDLRPVERGFPGSAQCLADGSHTQSNTPGDVPVRALEQPLLPQNLLDVSHG